MPPKRPDSKGKERPSTSSPRGGGFVNISPGAVLRAIQDRKDWNKLSNELTQLGFSPPGTFKMKFTLPALSRDAVEARQQLRRAANELKGVPGELKEKVETRRNRRRNKLIAELGNPNTDPRIIAGRKAIEDYRDSISEDYKKLYPNFAQLNPNTQAYLFFNYASEDDSEIEPAPEWDDYETKEYDGSDVRSELPDDDEEPVDPEPEPDFDSAPLVYRANIVPHLRGLPGVVTKPNIDSYFGDSYGPLPSTGFNRAYDLIAQAKHGVTKTSPGMPFPFGANSHASSRRMYRRKPSLVAKDLQNRLDACEIKLSYLLDELSEHINDPELKSVERELGKIELETVGFIRGSGDDNGNDSDTLSESD